MKPEFYSKKYRHRFANAFIRQGVAMQIQLLRKRERWSQKKLGELTDKKQNAIARLEDPSYGKFTITTLLELAKAFDVALSVRFVPFSELEKQSHDLTPDSLSVPSFIDEVPRAKNLVPPSEAIDLIRATHGALSVRSATAPKRLPLIQATGAI